MNPVLTLLRTKVADIEPTDRFVLARWVLAWNRSNVEVTQADICAALELPERLVSKSLMRLTRAGLVERKRDQRRMTETSRGQIAAIHSPGLGFLKLLPVGEPPDLIAMPIGEHHFGRIVAVVAEPFEVQQLKGHNRQPPKRKGLGARLNPTNRIHLVTLLAYADELGVVSESPAKLAKLIGVGSVRFEAQLQKLADLGYIRARVPGVSGRTLFGVRAGRVVLNLQAPAYGRSILPALHFIFPDICQTLYPDVTRLFAVASKLQVLTVAPPNGWVRMGQGSLRHRSQILATQFEKFGIRGADAVLERLVTLLSGPGTTTLASYFARLVEEVAEDILSSHWDALPLLSRDLEQQYLDTVIARIKPPQKKKKSSVDDTTYLESSLQHLAGFAFQTAFRLAITLKSSINEAVKQNGLDQVTCSHLKYLILPRTKGVWPRPLVVSACSFNMPPPTTYSCVISPNGFRLGGSEVECLVNESKFSIAQMNRYGLLEISKKERVEYLPILF